MYTKPKVFSLCIIAAVCLLAAAGGWAEMVCTEHGDGDDEAIIAVAANFVEPVKELVVACQTDNYCPNTKYTICADATKKLQAAIDANYSAYGYFFAADTTAQVYSTHAGAGTAYQYVKGIPVFFAYYTDLVGVNNLVTGLPSTDRAYNYSNTVSTAYPINTYDAQMIAVAGTAAPYGVAAHTLINGMMGTSLPGTIPGYVVNPLYGTVTNVFDAVTTDAAKSGFLSKSQICSPSGGVDTDTYVYVEFTHNDYTLQQYAIPLDTANSAVTALHSYVMTTLAYPAGSGWVNFATNHCYGPPPAP
jgi:molybdate transport system substrate-binding protein